MELLHTDKKSVQNLITEVFRLERIGDYEKAFELLSSFWSDITELPNVSELPPILAGEILLRCGAVVGFLGNLKQIPNAQEYSKNVLTAARSKFIELYKPEKIAECENYLSLSYWRRGEIKEATAWIETSLSHKLNNRDGIRLYSHIIKTLNLLAESKDDEVIEYLISVHSYFEETDYFLRGCYCTNLSLAYKNADKLDESLRHLNFARFCHQKSNHLSYLASVENNLAQLYKLRGEFSDAFEAVENAIRLYTKINDARWKALAIDTKAQIFIAQEDFENAVKFADEAIEILNFGDNAGILSELYLTKATALFFEGNIAQAVLAISEAVQLAKIAGEAQTKRIAESFETAWRTKFPPKIQRLYSEQEKLEMSDIEIDLPRGVSPNQKFFGIWIKNNHFKEFGLERGRFAIVVESEIEKGDLVAISDNETELVSIGFFDRDFGLIALENRLSEPELFNENQITILGKIIGYCEPEINSRGRYTVQPIPPKIK